MCESEQSWPAGGIGATSDSFIGVCRRWARGGAYEEEYNQEENEEDEQGQEWTFEEEEGEEEETEDEEYEADGIKDEYDEDDDNT